MKRVARSPGMAAPLTAAMRGADVSYLRRTSSGSSMIRCSMTGTANSTGRWCSAIACSVASGAKRRCSTIGQRMPSAICMAAKPQVWKIGASMSTVSLVWNGILDHSEASGPSPGRGGRRAPLGRPVVPELSTMVRPCTAGGSKRR